MATIAAFRETLEKKAPYLELVGRKMGFHLTFKRNPFTFMECNIPFNRKAIEALNDNDIERIIKEATPALDDIVDTLANRKEQRAEQIARLDDLRKLESWSSLAKAAESLEAIDSNIEVLELAIKHLSPSPSAATVTV